MRYAVMIQFASPQAEANNKPTKEAFEKMGAFSEALAQDGIVGEGYGLLPSSKGTRVRMVSGKPVATDGPFTESKELIAGFSILEAPSKEAIIERLQRHWPFMNDEQVEIRQIMELEDVMEMFPHLRE